MAKSRRTRTAHTGVKLVQLKRKRKGGTVSWWVARWTDPDSGKLAQASLDKEGATNAEARREWAKAKADELAERERALQLGGAVRKTDATLAEAFEVYFAGAGAELAERTQDAYRRAARCFQAWCERAGVDRSHDLRPEHLAAWRASLRQEKAGKPKAGGRRGQKVEGGKRKASTGNYYLRGVKTILGELRRLGLVQLTRDDLADRLKAFKQPPPRPAFLKPKQVRELLTAAVKHDATCLKATRSELAELRGAERARAEREGLWRTPKYEPVTPLVVLALLTGARLEELLSLRWEQVDLATADGVVELLPEGVKTGEGREVWLNVSPCAKRLLLALKLRAEGPYVFGGQESWARLGIPDKARRRLIDKFGAPSFTWSQQGRDRTPSLRSTCATFGTNAGGIWGDAAHYASARRLGHSVAIAERHYAGRVRPPRDATTLEQAMEAEEAFEAAVDAVTGRRALAEVGS